MVQGDKTIYPNEQNMARMSATIAPLKERVTAFYTSNYHEPPHHMSFAPGRVNLIGEHTDYNMGLVLPGAIDRYIVFGIGASDDQHIHFTAMDYNETVTFDYKTLKKTSHWSDYAKGILHQMDSNVWQNGLRIVCAGNIPTGAGVSS